MNKMLLLAISSATLLASATLYAATPAAKTTAQPTPAPAEETAQSDVVGSKEAPGVFNIVPWKEKAVQSQKKEVNTSILRETLQPLDRDILRREIEFHSNAEQQ